MMSINPRSKSYLSTSPMKRNEFFYEFTHLEYHDITTSTLQTLKFRLVNEKNDPFEFSSMNNDVRMTLLLRQIE